MAPVPTRPSIVDPMKAGFSILTGTTVWLSTQPFDENAIGLIYHAGDKPDNGVYFEELIHPMTSPYTIRMFDSHLVELDRRSRSTPFQQGALTIPPEYFRGPMGPALAAIMDENWRESFYPDDPPADATPPSQLWDGRWYMYIACWWRVMSGAVYVPPSQDM